VKNLKLHIGNSEKLMILEDWRTTDEMNMTFNQCETTLAKVKL